MLSAIMCSYFLAVRTFARSPRWIRTDVWVLGPLRLGHSESYWLYRVNEDEMRRETVRG